MTTSNGRVPRSDLVEVEEGIMLARVQARAYRRAKAACKREDIRMMTAGRASGYRTLHVQDEMRRASLGNKELAKKYNLNSASTVPLASPGYSSHGLGDRVDLLFNGSSWPSAHVLAILARYGWTREFGTRDPNHFMHDHKKGTLPVTREWCLKYGLFVQPE